MSDMSSFLSFLVQLMMQLVSFVNAHWILQFALVVFVFALAYRLVKKYLLHD